jgi:recombination protein RecT
MNEITEQPTPRRDIKSLINSDAMRDQFARALPKHLTADRFTRVAITALTRVPKLQECTPESFMKCLLDLSAAGLEPDGRRAHLIPYENRKLGVVECQLIIDYKGLVELIRRSGDVVSLRAESVCEKDEFAWIDGIVTHAINWREDRGKPQAFYAEATMKSGEKQTATMTMAEVEAIRARSRSGNSGPWQTDFVEMAKKTVVRRLSKMLPLSSEIMRHVEADDTQFTMRNVTKVPSFVLEHEIHAERIESGASRAIQGDTEGHSA